MFMAPELVAAIQRDRRNEAHTRRLVGLVTRRARPTPVGMTDTGRAGGRHRV